jgi:hypothetical protein
LTAFKTHFVVAARAGLLTFVATACGFTQTRTNTTANTAAVFTGAICWLDFIELHG